MEDVQGSSGLASRHPAYPCSPVASVISVQLHYDDKVPLTTDCYFALLLSR